MKLKKNIAFLCTLPVAASVFATSSCSCSNEQKIVDFTINTKSGYVGKTIDDIATFSFNIDSEITPAAKLVDKNYQEYLTIKLTVKKNPTGGFTISTSELKTEGTSEVKIIIMVGEKSWDPGEIFALKVILDPYSLPTSVDDGFLFENGTISGTGKYEVPGGTIKSKTLVFGANYNSDLVKELTSVGGNYYHISWMNGTDVPEKVFINPKKSDYDGKEVSGLKINEKFFNAAGLTNVTYVFIGEGVILLGASSLGSINYKIDTPAPGGVTVEFDITDTTKIEVDATWFKSTCGGPETVASVVVPSGADKSLWATKLSFPVEKIINKQ